MLLSSYQFLPAAPPPQGNRACHLTQTLDLATFILIYLCGTKRNQLKPLRNQVEPNQEPTENFIFVSETANLYLHNATVDCRNLAEPSQEPTENFNFVGETAHLHFHKATVDCRNLAVPSGTKPGTHGKLHFRWRNCQLIFAPSYSGVQEPTGTQPGTQQNA